MNQEFIMNVYLPLATMHFEVETVEGTEDVTLEVLSGGELIEKIGQYYTKEYDKLFEELDIYVGYAYLTHIEYNHKQDDMSFNVRIDSDDSPTVQFKFNTNSLEDENAKKLKLVREVMEFDLENENPHLQALFKNM